MMLVREWRSRATKIVGVKVPTLVDCPYCRGTAQNVLTATPCEVCGGTGRVPRPDGSLKCRFCRGHGRDPYGLAPCPVCHGFGHIALGADAAETELPKGTVTILFTDVEGSTALTQRVGDAKAREVLRAHERIVREALQSHGGSEIKHTGDGIMASFPSATWAVESAIAMQRAFADYNETADEPISMCIGLNAGEPIAEEKDLFGTAVNMAARIAAKAEGGEIMASDVVRQLVAGKGFLFSDRGEVELKGFEEPVRLYEVRWRE